MNKDELLKMALEALEEAQAYTSCESFSPSMTNELAICAAQLRQALAQQKLSDSIRPKGKSITKVWVDEINQALEQPEQEPVAWMEISPYGTIYLYKEFGDGLSDGDIAHGWELIPLYTAPPKREFVGLTDEEIDYIWGVTKPDYENFFDFPRAIESKLKEKNHD